MLVDSLKKLLILAGSGMTSVILAACYGPMCAMKTVSRTLRVVGPDGKPIPGLKVQVSDSGESLYTDQNGEAVVSASFCEEDVPQARISVTIQDVDGPENGLYAEEDREVSPGDQPLTVVMTPAE